MTLSEDDVLPQTPEGEVVHWMARGPLTLGSYDIPASTLAAFALGVVATAAAFLVYRRLAPH